MDDRLDITEFLKKFNIKDVNNKLFVYALTHLSYVNENSKEAEKSYDRLEYLGDSIIGMLTARHIYDKNPKANSGQMSLLRSNIVDENSLAGVAMKLKIEKYVFLGKGEKRTNLSKSLYADLFESFIGAVYLVEGESKVNHILNQYLYTTIKKYDINDLKDFKTKLQELLQSQHRNDLVYETKNISRSVSKPFFDSKVIHEGLTLGQGTGKSKKLAEKDAAENAYKKLATDKPNNNKKDKKV
jgi:ribonuclease-3